MQQVSDFDFAPAHFDFGGVRREFDSTRFTAAKPDATGMVKLGEGVILPARLVELKRHEKECGPPVEVVFVMLSHEVTRPNFRLHNLLINPIIEVPLRGSGRARRFN